MKKLFLENVLFQFVFLFLVIFLSRLPFLFAGFGVEEDSWLLAITAKNIADSGVYEMSRAPAHPVQELLYALMYTNGLFAFETNFVSAISSAIATLFFALALKNLGFKYYLFASFAFAFTPVVFISSTYTIDYMLAMACVMGSFYCITRTPFPAWRWVGWGAVLLGVAIGCRTTAVVMLIPFCFLLFQTSEGRIKRVLIFSFVTILVGCIVYIPVIKTYGISFITTYFDVADRFPSPPFLKTLYKASIGVWGLIGFLTLLFFSVDIIRKRKRIILGHQKRIIFTVCLTTIFLYTLIYIRVPHKSAFLIPLIPFVITMYALFLSGRVFKILCMLITLSSFFFSINLTDSFRGSKYSPAAMKCSVSGQEIFIDPFTGPVFSDYTKRINKMIFTGQVLKRTTAEQKKIVLICGWWYNELLVRNWNCRENKNVTFVFYIDRITMEKYISAGYRIYYLPEQNGYNDQYSRMNYTDSVARSYM